ncbi:tail fiber domain-containing protein [Desertivirga arenae]|uniref:tail fiber domain-containing protein n=1 Tax=Desertivirga arenae TaxID=2810309 RepID=UPI001A969849|nr:tail fiber domain-containing protein [Pedobacter sp. SYSU D00823]
MRARKIYQLTTLILFLLTAKTKAQNVGINATGTAPDASAGLDIDFENKGILIPRINLISDTDILTIPSPAESLIVYNKSNSGTLTPGYYYWNGSMWIRIAVTSDIQATPSTNAWSLSGNSLNTSTNWLGTISTTDLPIRTNSIERMRIKSNGQVGIGSNSFSTANPEKLLVDAGATYNNAINAIGNIDGYLQVGVQNLSSGSNASSDVVSSSSNPDHYVDMGINSSGYITNKSNILNQPYTAYLYSSTPEWFFIGNGAPSKGLIFFTNGGNSYNANNSADGTERMVITSKGIVGIGYNTTANGTVNTPTDVNYLLSVNSKVLANAFNTPSDLRLKTNIAELNYGLKDILALKPVSYNWIDQSRGKEKQLGLIAQDTRNVIPEIVNGDEAKEKLSVNYTELIPVLINAIKEQQSAFEQQQKKIDQLEERLKALEQK